MAEAVSKFNQLARLCPQLVPTETERVRRMMGMFRPELTLAIDSGSQPPTTVADCLERAMRAEYHLIQVKEERAQFYKARKEEKGQSIGPDNRKPNQSGNPQPNHNRQGFKAQPQWNGNGKKRNHPGNGGNANSKVKVEGTTFPVCKTCGKMHIGECRKGTMTCFKCGQPGHFLKDCPKSFSSQNGQYQEHNPNGRLNFMQAAIEGPQISQGRLEAPPTTQIPPPQQARIYAYTNADALASSSNVVAGQLPIAHFDALVLFDSGATHCFISLELARKLGDIVVKINKVFRTALPSGDELLSEYWLEGVSIIIGGQELKSDFIVLEMKDFDAILGMDFLGENNAMIDCHRKRVIFKPVTGRRFTFEGRPLKKSKMLVSALQARRLMSKWCYGFLASVVDKTRDVEAIPNDVPVVRDYVDVFPEELPGLAPEREIYFGIELLLGTGPISKAPLPNGTSRTQATTNTTSRVVG